MRKHAPSLVIALIVLVAPASADSGGFFVGGGLGKSTLKNHEIYTDLPELPLTSEKTFAYKIFAGYRFLDYLAVEAGYADFGGEASWGEDVRGDLQKVKAQVNGWDAFAVGLLPLGKVDLIGKAGVMGWSSDTGVTSEGETFSVKESGTDFAFGLGLGFNLEHVTIRGEGEWFQIADAVTVFMFSISVAYVF